MTGVPKPEIAAAVGKAARLLHLEPLLDRRPRQLSGGQRQRVAIGRAIVRDPEVFLFDEPLSNLDAELRVEMRNELAQLHMDLKSTMIYVTHDQVEAMTLADRIVVMRGGVVEQVGAPMELYRNPRNAFVASFIGSPNMNFLTGALRDGAAHLTCASETPAAPIGAGLADGAAVHLGIRPEHIGIDTVGTVRVPGTVTLVEHLGGTSFVHARLAGNERLVSECRAATPSPGDRVEFGFDPRHAFVFDARGGARLA